MTDLQRRANVVAGVVQAVAISALIFLVAQGIIVGRPWWLILGPALALPEMTLDVLSKPHDLRELKQVRSTARRRITRTLSIVGMLLMILGIASV